MAVREGGQTYYLHTDHIGRPVLATNQAGAVVWRASYTPFGGINSVSVTPGALSAQELRIPGQWFQAETGLHQNWMRDYDPTTGRYLQADPLGLIDGPSVYGYARQSPLRYIDPRGEQVWEFALPTAGTAAAADGPLPFGDVVGLCILGATAVYCASDPGNCSMSVSEDCYQQWEDDLKECSARFSACMMIANASRSRTIRLQCGREFDACKEIANDNYTNCLKGRERK